MKLDYFRLLRINHWFKNIFLFIGVLLAVWHTKGTFFDYQIIINSLVAFFLASFISSANYIINQITDAKYDRKHPEKKDRPIASGRIPVTLAFFLSIIIFFLSFIVSINNFSLNFTIVLISLWIAGLLYNIRPIRLKDKQFIDVLSESANNPIRFLLGWFVVEPQTIPPTLIIFLTWSAGAILMTAKRYDELRSFGEKLIPYRFTFKKYSLKGLSLMLYFYTGLTFILYLLVVFKFNSNLLFTIPFLLVYLIWLVKEVISGRAEARSVEKFVLSKKFLVISIALVLIIILLA